MDNVIIVKVDTDYEYEFARDMQVFCLVYSFLCVFSLSYSKVSPILYVIVTIVFSR